MVQTEKPQLNLLYTGIFILICVKGRHPVANPGTAFRKKKNLGPSLFVVF